MTPNDSRLQKALEWAEAVSSRSEIEQSLSELSFKEHDYLGILAREVRTLKKDLAEARKERHPDHSHCVTPCDSIRIQDQNHSAWLLEKERAEKAEKDLADTKEQYARTEGSLGKRIVGLEAENAELRERVKELEQEGNRLMEVGQQEIADMEAESLALAETIKKKDETLKRILSIAMDRHYHDADAKEECDDYCLERKIEIAANAALALQPQPDRARKILDVVKAAQNLADWMDQIRAVGESTIHRDHGNMQDLLLSVAAIDAEQP